MTSAPVRLNEPVNLSHGTLEIADFPETMRFYRDFLGIGCHRHHTAAMSIFHKGEWLVACVKAGKALHRQGPENRWVLGVERPEDVDRAYVAAVTYRELFKIRRIMPVETMAATALPFFSKISTAIGGSSATRRAAPTAGSTRLSRAAMSPEGRVTPAESRQ
jgi:hypothetical protein